MQFNLLGPLEVVDRGRPVALGGVNQRAALSFLLMHPNMVVPTTAMVRALWNDVPPATSRKMVQNAIWSLRKLFERSPGEQTPTIVTASPGYRLLIEPDLIDLTGFHHLAGRGRALLAGGDWEGASRNLRRALALWRGSALADLAEAGFDWPELTALRNEHLTAYEDWAESELARGLHTSLVGELLARAQTEPTRERLSGLLMLALYRSSRQSEALAAYQRTRVALADSYGLDPGRELREMERAILNHDETLKITLPPLAERAMTALDPLVVSGIGSAFGVMIP